MPTTGTSSSKKLRATEDITAFALGAGPPENNMPTLLNFGFMDYSILFDQSQGMLHRPPHFSVSPGPGWTVARASGYATAYAIFRRPPGRELRPDEYNFQKKIIIALFNNNSINMLFINLNKKLLMSSKFTLTDALSDQFFLVDYLNTASTYIIHDVSQQSHDRAKCMNDRL